MTYLAKYTKKTSQRPLAIQKNRTRDLWRVLGQRPSRCTRASLPTLTPNRSNPIACTSLNSSIPLDVAFKVVGTGSVGLRDYVVLMSGQRVLRDPLFLQIKQEVSSAYAPYLKGRLFPTKASAPPTDNAKSNPCQIYCSVGPASANTITWFAN